MKTKYILSYFLFTILMNVNITASAQATNQGSLVVCIAPGGLSTKAITSSSATVSWAPVSRGSNYTVQYKLSSVLKWTTAATATTATSLNITGLAAATLYDWRVRTNCSGGNSIYIQSQFTTSSNACAVPIGLASSAVTSTSVTASWVAATGAVSYNLQYKTAAALTWTNIGGIATTSYTLTGLTASTTYNYQVKSVCSVSSSSAYSETASVTTETAGISYCTTKGTTTYEYINKVALGTISNTSGNNGGYKNYTALTTNLTAGSSASITLTPGYTGTAYREYWTVYIDYNQDGDFTDAGEQATTGNGTSAVSRTFTVPATAKSGATRMRIIMHYGSSRTNTCGTFNDGEVEDYSVNVTGGTGFAAIKSSAPDDALVVNNAISISIAPNPVPGSNATVSYNLTGNGKTVLQVINADGSIVRSIQLGNQTTGTHNYILTDLNLLSSGIYILQLNQDGQPVIRKRFVLAR